MGEKKTLGKKLLQRWYWLHRLPAGRWLFGFFLFRRAPYSGSIGARILVLEPGYARIELPDRHCVRNHLDSIHAVALVNLGELVSGLAMLVGLPAGVRGIVSHLKVEYLKKARGTLVAESRCVLTQEWMERITTAEEGVDYNVFADIRDAGNDIVAKVEVCWRLGSDG